MEDSAADDKEESFDEDNNGACDSNSAHKFAVCFCRRFVTCLSNSFRRAERGSGDVVNRGSVESWAWLESQVACDTVKWTQSVKSSTGYGIRTNGSLIASVKRVLCSSKNNNSTSAPQSLTYF